MKMIDWTGITGLQEGVTKTVDVVTPAIINQAPTFLSSVADYVKIDEKSLNLGRDVAFFAGNDLTWTDRMVDRFTAYLDLKFEEFKSWVAEGLFNFGQGTMMFIIQGGQLFCILYGVGLVFKMMILSKKEEDFITKGILAAGGYLMLKTVEVMMFGA